MTIDEAAADNMNVVHPCAAGLDAHKLSAAASVRVWKGCGEDGEVATRGSCFKRSAKCFQRSSVIASPLVSQTTIL